MSMFQKMVLVRGLLLVAVAAWLLGCGGSGSSSTSSGGGTPVAGANATLSATSLSFASQAVGSTATTQTVTLTNSGGASLTLTGVTLSGANATSFGLSGTCLSAASLAGSASCTIVVSYAPTVAGSLAAAVNVADSATGSPQTIALVGIATAAATKSTVDCSLSTGLCPTISIAGEPGLSAGFHGEADPSLRKDPNASFLYMAFSSPHGLPDGTPTVDLRLAHSVDGGATFTYDGAVYAHTASSAMTYSGGTYYPSTETVDLLPIAQGSSTLWIQSHQEYLVAAKTAIYDNLYTTAVTSISAVLLTNPASGTSPAALYQGFGTAPEARLGGSTEGATRGVTQNLAALNAASAKCASYGQSTLTYVPGASGATGILYLALECGEQSGGGNIDAHELTHFLYTTTPTGTDASKWVWAYAGEFATPAQAVALGNAEGTAYAFFTEPEFIQTTAGLAVVISPSVFAPQTAQQPVIQYGCRVILMSSLTTPALAVNASGVPSVSATVTEKDLYTGANEGPGACTYDPASSTGVIVVRKLENDPVLGFAVSLQASGLKP